MLRHYFSYRHFHTKHSSFWRYRVLQNGWGVFNAWGVKFSFFSDSWFVGLIDQILVLKRGGGCLSRCSRSLRFWPKSEGCLSGGVFGMKGTVLAIIIRDIVLFLSCCIKICFLILLQNKFSSSCFQKNFCFTTWKYVFSFFARRISVWPKHHYWSHLGWCPS